ncbi:MAG: 6-phosphofructokinase, partial [Elusimicrobiota bacterium]|nr:6-phosphofructokinase [Elusimicrobiota bacterium]
MTPGGDAPGMNASIRAVVRKGIFLGYEIFGIRRGYAGLLTEDFIPMDKNSVGGIIHHGGTILKSARCEEIKTDSGILSAAEILTKHNFNYLIIIGGDGS